MNQDRDTQRLLDDVVAEAPDAGLRGAVLQETLQLARRRRQGRRIRRAAVALLAVGFVGLAGLRFVPAPDVPGPIAAPTAYVPVHTAPISVALVVSTRPAVAELQIGTLPSVEVVTTTPFSGRFRNVSDEELLALVAPYPAALIRIAPGREELMFANPGDEQMFQ